MKKTPTVQQNTHTLTQPCGGKSPPRRHLRGGSPALSCRAAHAPDLHPGVLVSLRVAEDRTEYKPEGATEEEVSLAPQAMLTHPELTPQPSDWGTTLCQVTITQQDVAQSQPYLITHPGQYCLVEDIIVSAANTSPAIVIQSNEVELGFVGHTLRATGPASVNTGVEIDRGYERIRIHGGQIEGFESGVNMAGGKTAPVSAVTVEHMDFLETHIGIRAAQITDVLIADNTFDANSYGIILYSPATGSTGTIIRHNDFTLAQMRPGGSFAIDAYFSLGIVVQDNLIFGNETSPELQFGIALRQGSDPGLSVGNIVEGNVIAMTHTAIILHDGWGDQSGHGSGADNIIRSNQIFGGVPASDPWLDGPAVSGRAELLGKRHFCSR